MTEFITSDTHFFHKKILSHCDRPFNNLEEMHNAYIAMWNVEVNNGDTVWVLGDLTFWAKPEEAASLVYLLKGKINLIPGNHDKDEVLKAVKKGYIPESKLEVFPSLYEIKRDKKLIVLCHFPLYSWNGMAKDSIHLHGHTHTREIDKPPIHKNRFNVGVDWNKDGVVYTLEEVLEKIEKQNENSN